MDDRDHWVIVGALLPRASGQERSGIACRMNLFGATLDQDQQRDDLR